MSKIRRTERRRAERGQALLLAVIVLLVMALLGAAMIAVVGSSIESSGRDEVKVRSRLLAEAGVRYADEMLTSSAQGADWRPVLADWLIPDADTDNKSAGDPSFSQTSYDSYYDSFEILRGWDSKYQQASAGSLPPVYFVKFRFAMDPTAVSSNVESPTDDPSQDFVQVTGTPADAANKVRPVENNELTAPHDHFLLKIEYAPDDDDPLSKYLKITSVGRPGEQLTAFQELVAYKPVGIQDYLLFIHDLSRAGTTATLGQPAVDIDGDGSTNASARDDYDGGKWEATGPNDFLPLVFDGPVRSNVNVQVLAPVSFEPVQSASGWRENVEIAGSLTQVADSSASDGNAEVLVEDAGGASMTVYGSGNTAEVVRNEPTTPGGATWPSQLNVGVARRIEAPALDSYEPLYGISRWDRLTRASGDEVAVDGVTVNSGELGYGAGIYVDNGDQLDLFDTAQNAWLRPETWGGRQYVPKGCIIELFAHYPDPLNVNDAPAIAITRTDGSTWRTPSDGSASGRRTMVFRWPNKDGTWSRAGTWSDGGPSPTPDNGIILCEGNVRILGMLPAPGTSSTDDYDLTVVSRGSIYIDGPLLRPSDYSSVAETAANNTRIALLAHDHVVLNPTMLAPGPVPGMPAAPYTVPADNPDDAHFVLDPGGSQGIGLRAVIASTAYNGNRHVVVVEADGNVNDGLDARAAVVFNKTRQTIGTAPGFTSPATTSSSLLLSLAANNLPQIPGLTGIGTPAFFTDWRNLARAIYNNNTEEFEPDQWGIAATNFNDDPAAHEPGVPSFITVQSGIDQVASPSTASRSDLIVKNLKVERWANGDSEQPRPGFDFVVSALMYAERGGFYIIPGDWFDSRVERLSDVYDSSVSSPDLERASARFARLKRYNYRITINGAIAVNQMPSLMEVGEWADKWCYPADQVRQSDFTMDTSALSGATLFNDYGTIRYRYDWGLRTKANRINRLRLPALPASPGVIYVGEENQR